MVYLSNVQHPTVCKCQIYVNLYADILFLGKFKTWPSRDMTTGSVSLIVLMMEHLSVKLVYLQIQSKGVREKHTLQLGNYLNSYKKYHLINHLQLQTIST